MLGMFLYGIGLMPLCERLCTRITLSTSLNYADNIASVDQAAHNAECLSFLVEAGPKYEYFPSPEKSFYICKGDDGGGKGCVRSSEADGAICPWAHVLRRLHWQR